MKISARIHAELKKNNIIVSKETIETAILGTGTSADADIYDIIETLRLCNTATAESLITELYDMMSDIYNPFV